MINIFYSNNKMNIYLKYFILSLIVLSLDISWISLNYSKYNDTVKAIQGSPISLNPLAGILCYVVILISVLFYALPYIEYQITVKKYEKWQACLIFGGGLGFIIMAIYNLTTLSILKNHNWTITIIDCIWGTFLYTVSTVIYFYLL